MQKRADDPREVAALARRQERELRDWLFGDRTRNATARASPQRCGRPRTQVEDDHRVAVEVVVVGDCALDERAEARARGGPRGDPQRRQVRAATRGPIAVYAEVGDGGIEVFVRDRGPGFDPAGVPADRRGVRESIVGRMERAGGRAEIRSTPASGTEVDADDREPAPGRSRR